MRNTRIEIDEIIQIIPVTGNWQAVFLSTPLIEQSEPVIVALPVVSWALIENRYIDRQTKKVTDTYRKVEGLSVSPSEYPDNPEILAPDSMVSCEYFHEFLGYTNDGNVEQFKTKAMEYFKEWLKPQLKKGKKKAV